VYLVSKEWGLSPFEVRKWPMSEVMKCAIFLKMQNESTEEELDDDIDAAEKDLNKAYSSSSSSVKKHKYQFK